MSLRLLSPFCEGGIANKFFRLVAAGGSMKMFFRLHHFFEDDDEEEYDFRGRESTL
jgi:hypothetical protein